MRAPRLASDGQPGSVLRPHPRPPFPAWLGPGALAHRPTRSELPPRLAPDGPSSLSPSPCRWPHALAPCTQTPPPHAGGVCVLGRPALIRTVARSLKPSARPPLPPKLARVGTAPHHQGEKPREDARGDLDAPPGGRTCAQREGGGRAPRPLCREPGVCRSPPGSRRAKSPLARSPGATETPGGCPLPGRPMTPCGDRAKPAHPPKVRAAPSMLVNNTVTAP